MMPKVEINGVEYRPVIPRVIATTGSTLGRELRDSRKALCLSFAEAAKMIGCSKGYLFAIEHDQSMPSLEFAQRISEAYGIPVAELAALTTQSRMNND